MITRLMIYGTEVAVLVSIAAWAFERVAIWRGFTRRGCWAAALLLSVGIPVISILIPAQTPPRPTVTPVAMISHDTPARATAPPVPLQGTNIPAQNPTPGSATQQPGAVTLETALVGTWCVGTCGLLMTCLFLTLRLRQAARNWRLEQIDGQEVWITDSVGPAVYGFFRPMILIPEWLLQAAGAERSAALAHERSHLVARDPALLLLGLLLITLFPWNLPLWWQLRRLRFAIEVDCDARVLNEGMSLRDYGSALLAIGERGISAPIAAVALTEPASQLQRRIRIMTTDIAKPGKAAMLATIVLASACIGVAARTQAPPVTTDLPRKLPAEDSNSHPQIEALVRATYPQFFRDAGNTGPVLVNLFLNPDGSLYKSVVEAIAPRPYITKSFQAFDQVHIDYEHRGPHVWFRMNGASGLPVDVIAWYFQTPSDPTRDIATVRAKVRARYPDIGAEDGKVVTVLMTDNGEVDRAIAEDLNGRNARSLVTASHFANLGRPSNQLGIVGVTSLTNGHFTDDADRKNLPVVYAWPRRPNEPEMKLEAFEYGALPAPGDDRAVDRQIAEKYFPDLYTHPSDWPRADPWILLDRQGKVLTTGRRAVMSRNDVQLNIESQYPGIKTDQWQIVPLTGPTGQEADVSFVWLAADSPVTDPSKADFSKQPDVLINADVNSGDKTFYTQMLALNFGSSGVTQCALRNPFGVVYLQLAIAENDADSAAVRIRAQHLSLPDTEAIPDADATAWSPQSAPVRAPYSAPSAPMEITDKDGKKWTIVLHTDRLKHVAPARS